MARKILAVGVFLLFALSEPVHALQLASRATEEWDVAFINDVLHHIEHRAAYLKALGTYVKAGGRVALIEMNKDDPNTAHKGQPDLLVGRQDIDKWMADAGFKLVQEYPDLFPGTKWFLVYGKK